MSARPLIHRFDPRLRQKSLSVVEFDHRIRQLAEDLIDTMKIEKGIGLAAVQIGELHRMAVIGLPVSEVQDVPTVMINPEISGTSDDYEERIEGCLSLPGLRLTIRRPRAVTVKYQDVDGTCHQIDADGLLAACIQHEIDHMDGILIEDKVSRLQRELARKAARKSLPR